MTDDMDALAERMREAAKWFKGCWPSLGCQNDYLRISIPANVLALLADRERLKGRVEWALDLAGQSDASLTKARQRIEALERENAKLWADRQKVEAASLELIETTQRLTEASETMRGKLLPLQLEADALRARVAELAELLTSASSAMPEWFAHLHERIDAALGATKGEGHDEA